MDAAMSEKKRVSVVIPCRNEEDFIKACLQALSNQTYPLNKLEVIVVDGMSSDNTRLRIAQVIEQYPFIRCIDNPRRVTPLGLNKGIAISNGDYVIILSSHSVVEPDFIENNVRSLETSGADCVGGILETVASIDRPLAHAIAAALSHPYGVGNAHFRIGSTSIREVDTVPFGCYKREVFESIGFFDENLIRNQDDEFNFRLLRNGGRIVLDPLIKSRYFARDSLRNLWKMYFQYGYFKPLVALKIGRVITWRQLVPALFVGALLGTALISIMSRTGRRFLYLLIALYLCTTAYFSYMVGRKRNAFYATLLFCSFAVLHFSYGIGYLKGILDFCLKDHQLVMEDSDISLSR